ncbi:MAG: hypothetical protein ACOX7X_05305 [Methanosarcina flavescens]
MRTLSPNPIQRDKPAQRFRSSLFVKGLRCNGIGAEGFEKPCVAPFDHAG